MARVSKALKNRARGMETELGVIAPRLGLRENAGAVLMSSLDAQLAGRLERISWDARQRLGIHLDNPWDERHHRYFSDSFWRTYQNILLQNGTRVYMDGAQLEISQATATDPKMALVWNRAAYRLLDEACRRIKEEEEREFLVFRNNVASDSEVHRYAGLRRDRSTMGSHWNLAGLQSVPEEELIRKTIPLNIVSIILHGAGKIGFDCGEGGPDFQISQRADFIRIEAGPTTTSLRPIVCTRNFDHGVYANPKLFRRNHHLLFDSNMLELPEYLKNIHAIFLSALEDGFIDDRFEILEPVSALHQISRDPELNTEVWLTNQRKLRHAV